MEERLKKIIAFIENYRKYSKGDEFIDCYQVFELNKDDNRNNLLNEIKNKKLKILFHPDLYAFIPTEYQEDFLVLSNFTKDLENIFSEDYLKKRYDENLKDTVSDKDIMNFNKIIIDNIYKYGFTLSSLSIKMIINNNDFKGITRENNNRKSAIDLGREKITNIINAFKSNKHNENFIDTNIIKYFSFLLYQNEYLMNLMNIYINACDLTIQKYGPSQLEWAINQSITLSEDTPKDKRYKGFTNDGEARTNLREFINNPRDLLFLSKIYLNINLPKELENINLSTLTDVEIIRTFTKLIVENQTKEDNNNRGR